MGETMGTGAAGGCGIDEKPCPFSRAPADITARKSHGGIDIFSQAEKALTERSPHDVEVSENDGGQESGATSLPAGLVEFLAKYMDKRKKTKKSHSCLDSKKKTSIRQKKWGNIWIDTEVYFKDLTLPDVETLFQLSTFLTPGWMEYLSIPAVGHAVVRNSLHSAKTAVPSSGEDMFIGRPTDSADCRSCDEMVSIEVASDNVPFTCVSGDEMVSVGVAGDSYTATCMSDDEMVSFGFPNDSVAATCRSGNEIVSSVVLSDSVIATRGSDEEMDVDDGKVIKTENKQETGIDVYLEEAKYSSPHLSPRPSVSVEWVLGSKNKIILASERPSKKRKLLGENAGLEILIVSQPCEGNPNLCHFCSQGNFDSEQSNRLIICSTCGVSVHKKCYGVEENDIIESTWLCSWCKHTNNSEEVAASDPSGDRKPCFLCPKQGGALKPLETKDAGNPGSVKFGHMFCSQWMQEVYVEDTKLMEPMVNVDGINETRRKLVCSICKKKYGICVRCSHGTCRALFHPICAREANHRTEIWGKPGNIDVKLRAFCSKHSDISVGNEDVQQLDSPTANGGDTSLAMISSKPVLNGHDETKFGCYNGDISDVQLEAPCNSAMQNDEFVDEALQNGGAFVDLEPENCSSEHSLDAEALKVNHIDGFKPSVAFLLKRLIDRGKVNQEEISLEMGMTPGSLAATLATDTLTPESQTKAVSWLKSHAYLGSLQRNVQVKIKSAVCYDSKLADVTIEPDAPSAAPIKPVSPCRRTHGNVRILEVVRSSFLSKNTLDNETVCDEAQVDNSVLEPNGTTDGSSPDSIEKVLLDPASTSSTMEPSTTCPEPEKPSFPVGGTTIACPRSVNEGLPSCIHMSVYGELMQFKSDILFSEADNELNVSRLKQVAQMDSSLSDGICHYHKTKTSADSEACCENGCQSEELNKAEVLGVFDMAPVDELEGELVFFQHRLLDIKSKRRHFCDGLVCSAVKSLPSQIDFVRSQRWNSVCVNKYLAVVREAKKQGKKEQREREAQLVLAAATATAAAASSSRISTFRKDDLDESSQENPAKASHMLRPVSQSQCMPVPKEMMSREAVPGKESDFLQSDKDNPRSCDVCCRQETILSAILICSICKVSVHLNCYRSIKDSIGPWLCEFCEDMTSRCSRPLPVNSWKRPIPSAECAVCGGTLGAFRKSADGQWIHAFCAEWTLQSTFRKGQIDPIGGLESITMGNDACCVCRLKKGFCLKCHYGHCQSTFHPSCARSAGFYMNIKSSGSKILHKAYCKKRSSEQRLKRDLLICSHDILASKRDSVAFSILVRSPFFRPDVSSDSATTSLYNSGSEAIRKLDDMTVDSSSSVKKPLNLVGSIENDRKTKDGSTTQLVFNRKQSQRIPCAGKKILNRTSSIFRNLSDDSGYRSNIRKLPETFDKELVMTSDQASLKNQRLPKGFVYVPVELEYMLDDDPGSRDGDG